MNTIDLKKLSREELIEHVENLYKRYEFDLSSPDAKAIDFRTMVESAYDIIFMIDKDRRIQYTNKAWKEIFSSRDSTLGRIYTDYLHEIEIERGNMVVDSVLKNGQIFKNELLKIYENGKPYYFVTNFSPIYETDMFQALVKFVNTNYEQLASKAKVQYIYSKY